ncbi:hypothetical protein PRUB_a5329 [Pseudoalteromonas rubra]|uniref:Uncharacterized protein n=1 Tax=Pseudoalteromonas rubra TaxID=43658 RepID=A0A8T0CAE2_9GAMM|nr:subtilase [Pseudoalteromonas rubra]KAF7787649.1 hypothetical protein PRUB_a5329 [Pseudoalteromonas rubra]
MGWFNFCFLLLISFGSIQAVNAQQTSGFNRYVPQLPPHASGIHLKGSSDQLSWVAVSGATYYYIEAYRGYEVYQARDNRAIDTGIMGNERDQLSQANAGSAPLPNTSEVFIPRYQSYGRSYTLAAPFSDARYLIIPCNQVGCGAGFVAQQYDAQHYYLSIESFQTDSLTVLPWEQTKLSWKVAGAHNVSLLKDGQPYRTGLPGHGSETVKLGQSARFTLRAEGLNQRTVEKQLQLIYHEVADPDTVHHGVYSVRLQSIGLDPVPRTVVAVDDKYLFLVDKHNSLHKVDHSQAQVKVVWTQRLSGKVVNQPLSFDGHLYFGVSRLDGSGEVCRLAVQHSTRVNCKTTSDGVIAGAVMVKRMAGTGGPIDDTMSASRLLSGPGFTQPLYEPSIVFIDRKGLVMEYDEALSGLYQSAYLPSVMRQSDYLVTPSADAQARTLYLPFTRSDNGERSVAAISIDEPGTINGNGSTGPTDPVDPINPGGPIDPIGPGGPIDPIGPGGPIDPIGPGGPIDHFSAPLRLPSERELARSIQNAAYNDNMITVEWTKEVGAGNE